MFKYINFFKYILILIFAFSIDFTFASNPLHSQFRKIVFYKIKSGTFLRKGELTETIKVKEDFDFQDTELTQWQYASIQILSGEKNIEIDAFENQDEKPEFINIEGNLIKMYPNHPMVKINSNFFKNLNDLSNSENKSIQNKLKEIIPGHIRGSKYGSPNRNQRLMVLNNRGNAQKKWFDSNEILRVKDYAWYSINSNNHTHDVATRKPRMIDTGYGIKPFYDLEGNVYEFATDDTDLIGGVFSSSEYGMQTNRNFTSAYRDDGWLPETHGIRMIKRISQ